LTLDQYHALVIQDFTVYSAAHPEVWSAPDTFTALMAEITSSSVLSHVVGDVWSGL
jgi:hypothetical protein